MKRTVRTVLPGARDILPEIGINMSLVRRTTCLRFTIAILFLVLPEVVFAKPSVLILDCALQDDTMLPDVPDELARTASVAPVLRATLREFGYTVPDYVGSDENLALTETGYFLAHPKIAAELGRSHNADWVGICTQFKFSFLVSILRVHLVDVAKNQVVTHAETWMRGSMTDFRMTRRSTRSLGEQVDDLLQQITVADKPAVGANR